MSAQTLEATGATPTRGSLDDLDTHRARAAQADGMIHLAFGDKRPADLDLNDYPTKIKLTKQKKEAIPITRHEFHGDWNYTIRQPDG